MQEHTLETHAREFMVPVVVAVLVVAGDRVAGVQQMDADLVGAAGEQFAVEQAGLRPAAQEAEHRLARLALGGHAHPALAVAGDILEQRRLHRPLVVAPFAAHQRQIVLVGGAIAQFVVQAA